MPVKPQRTEEIVLLPSYEGFPFKRNRRSMGFPLPCRYIIPFEVSYNFQKRTFQCGGRNNTTAEMLQDAQWVFVVIGSCSSGEVSTLCLQGSILPFMVKTLFWLAGKTHPKLFRNSQFVSRVG